MKTKCGILHVAACAYLMSVLGAGAAYQFQPFDAGTTSGWLSASAYLTNAAQASGWAIALPGASGGSVISNGTTDAVAGQVWTDFYAKPVPYSYGTSVAPDIDTTATAQIFVKTNGYWATFSGNGSGGYLTNVLTNVVIGTDTTYPLATNSATYYHVSVLSDYVNTNYSLFVNNKCLATNLAFISFPSDTTRWFQMKNLSTLATNVCLLDEYWRTNTMMGVPGREEIVGGGIALADALQYFGTVTPRAAATNAGISGTTVTWKLNVAGNEGDDFIVLGGPETNNIGTAEYDAVLGAGNSFALDLGANSKYFYKVIRKSAVDASVTITNLETYAAYAQGRVTKTAYIVGVPVDMLDGDRTLGGTLGRQLATGLASGDQVTVYSGGGSDTHTLQGDGTWAPGGATTIAPGQAVKITRQSVGGATRMIVAGTLPTNAISQIDLVDGPNAVSWPYESLGSLSAIVGATPRSGFTLGDYILIQTNSSQVLVGHYDSENGWKSGVKPNAGTALNVPLSAGSGIIIYHTGGGTPQWAP